VTVNINSIYNQYFPVSGTAPTDWKGFNNYKAVPEPTSKVVHDYAVRKSLNWKDRAKAISLLILKIIILPWGLYEVTKALLARIVLLIAYPAQIIYTSKQIKNLRLAVEAILTNPLNKSWIGREIVLEKNGLAYKGLIWGHESNISNGKWALFSSGNTTLIEGVFIGNYVPSVKRYCAVDVFINAGYNVLMVNGPGVGNSQGPAIVERMGDAQEAGISFLETAVKAKRVVLAGHSMGVASIWQGITQHTFKKDVDYLAVPMMTFSRLSHVVQKQFGSLAGKMIRWLGCEMDSIIASKKLQKEGIHEVVIEGEKDEFMRGAGLLETLQKEKLMENKTGLLIEGADHCDLPFDEITRQIQKWDQSLDPAQAG
jgi:hypothetical protein